GHADIYAQRYNSGGQALGKNFRVNDDSGKAVQSSPCVAVDRLGRFVVAWQDDRNDGDPDIYAQFYGADGNKVGGNVRVNGDTGHSPQGSPSIAVSPEGKCVMAWDDQRSGDADVYVQFYGAGGSAIGGNQKANEDVPGNQCASAVSMDAGGSALVAWSDGRESAKGIYVQHFTPEGTMVGPNRMVFREYSIPLFYQFSAPEMAMDHQGNYSLAWQVIHYLAGHINTVSLDIDFRCYDRNDSLIASNSVYVFSTHESIVLSFTTADIAMNESGKLTVVWEDWRKDPGDILAQLFKADGTSSGGTFKVNEEGGGTSDQNAPALAMGRSGRFMVLWQDGRNQRWDVYAQCFDESGTAVGQNFMVYPSDHPSFAPTAASYGADAYVVAFTVWNLLTYPFYRYFTGIVGRCYNSQGSSIVGNIGIPHHPPSQFPTSDFAPTVSTDRSGRFVAAWEFRASTFVNEADSVKARIFRADGEPLSDEILVNDYVKGSNQYYSDVAVAMDARGGFIVVWTDHRNGNADIYAQRYDSLGSRLGKNFKVNDDSEAAYQWTPTIAMDDLGNALIAWSDQRNGNNDIYAQQYDLEGRPVNANFKVNDDSGSGDQKNPCLATSGSGNSVIVWEDYRDGSARVTAQQFDSQGRRAGLNYRVANEDANPPQESPVVAVNEDQIAFVWTDKRRGMGWDVYGKLVACNWDSLINVEERENQKSPDTYMLFQNFPNPFNEKTVIRYRLAKTSRVILRIVNALGQEIRRLVDEEQPAADHAVQWDGKNDSGSPVVSGVYLVRMEGSGFAKTRKAVLMR
ncbi:MAG TPA: FlgD immunoglobulin-like domain containing protein, partial [bacterium]